MYPFLSGLTGNLIRGHLPDRRKGCFQGTNQTRRGSNRRWMTSKSQVTANPASCLPPHSCQPIIGQRKGRPMRWAFIAGLGWMAIVLVGGLAVMSDFSGDDEPAQMAQDGAP